MTMVLMLLLNYAAICDHHHDCYDADLSNDNYDQLCLIMINHDCDDADHCYDNCD